MPNPNDNANGRALTFTVTVHPITEKEVKAIVLSKLNGVEKIPYDQNGMRIIQDALAEAMQHKVTVQVS